MNPGSVWCSYERGGVEWGEGVGGRCLRFPENEKGRKVLGGFESPAPL